MRDAAAPMSDPRAIVVAAAVPRTIPGDIDGNLDRMIALAHLAAGAKLVLFSECAITGYDLAGRGVEAAVRGDDPRLDRLARLARERDLAVVAGFHEACGNAIHNTAVAMLPDGTRLLQRKQSIVGQERADGRVRTDNAGIAVWSYRGLRWSIVICADHGITDVYGDLRRRGCDVVLAPTAGLGPASAAFTPDDLHHSTRRDLYLKAMQSVCLPVQSMAAAAEHRLAMVFSNQLGYEPDQGYFHPGHGFVIAGDGRLVGLAPGEFVGSWLRPQLAIGAVR